MVGSRGMSADCNEHVLYLVDGHVQNSIVGQGYQQQDMLPVLEKVKQIEIIRGPGSVLWGSSAVWGIINIITKDGVKNGGNQVTTGYSNADGLFNANYQYSFASGDNTNGILSLSYWQSEGFNRSGKTTTKNDWWNATTNPDVKSNIEFPWGAEGGWQPLDKMREGYEMYAKINLGDNKILGRLVESNIAYPWDTWQFKDGADLTMRKAYLEFRNTSKFSDAVTMESSFYGDLMLQNRFPSDTSLFKPDSTGSTITSYQTVFQDQSNEELAFGAESMATLKVLDNNDLKVGLKAVRTKVGPNRDTRFNTILNSEDTSPSITPQQNTHIGVESGFDNNLAAYAEDIYTLGSTKIFAGGRFDWDDFRENTGIFLPRGGVIQSLGDLTAKYIVNTGYFRPELVSSKTLGVISDPTRGPTQNILRIDKSEQIISNDLQISWKSGKNYAALTAFYEDIKNYFSFDANNNPQGYKNMGDAYTKGVELEGKYETIPNLFINANYSLAIAKLVKSINRGAQTNDQDEFLNYPQNLFNVGLDYLINDVNSVNLNVNGWSKMYIVLPITQADPAITEYQFSELKSEVYLDLAYNSKHILGTTLGLTVFVNNLLNNTDAVGLMVNNGVWYHMGRNIGATLSYAF
jgi:outer membrane receptor protein involved in Fe transport